MSWPTVGDLLPRADEAWGIGDKLEGYVLNTEHADGGPKANYLSQALDIELADLAYLEAEIAEGARSQPITGVRGNEPYGVTCEVVMPIQGLRNHNDRVVDLLTIWELRDQSATPRLVTAYPDR
ncbi:MAG TPA: hypothetical protein VGN69_09545 [Solirubrobacteraceae bacterium]|jgi:hypothetical protein|nr:hypothetical protein [Solirubrobacteraceae bacterium]